MSALLSLSLVAFVTPVQDAEPEGVAIVGARVLVIADGSAREDTTILVSDGEITAVGPAAEVPVPAGYTRVDAAGKTVIPGLAEMHGHLPGPGGQGGAPEDVLFLYLANGITTVRGMLGDPTQLELREALLAGDVLGPRLFVGSPPLSGWSAQDPAAAAGLVKTYAEAGYDHLKVHENLTPEVYGAIAAAADEHGITFSGHVSDLVGLGAALAAGQATVDHLDNFVRGLVPGDDAGALQIPEIVEKADEERLDELVGSFVASGAAVVPTMALWAAFLSGTPGTEYAERYADELRYVPVATVNQWTAQVDQMARNMEGAGNPGQRILELRDAVLGALSDAGAPILLGTDSPQLFSVPGFSLHNEMAAMEAAGMTPLEILQAGTIAVGAFYGEESGEVAPGMRADLVVLDGDPLESLGHARNVHAVVVGGTLVTKAEIDERLAEIAGKYAE